MFTVKTRDNKQYELPLSCCLPEDSAPSSEVPCSSKLFEHIMMFLVDGIPIKERYSEVSKRVISLWLKQPEDSSEITIASVDKAESLVSSGKQYKKIIISDEFEGSLSFLKSQSSVVYLAINPKAVITDNSIKESMMHLSSLEVLSLPDNFEYAYELIDLSETLVNVKIVRNYKDDIYFLKGFRKLEDLSSGRINKNIHFLKSSLKKLTLLDGFNRSIEALSALTDLETLAFGCDFNQPIESLSALTNLESLTFGYHFNRPIEPLSALTNLKSLTFVYKFNQRIEPLSALTNLKSLRFGWDFNQPIEPLRALTNLKSLTFEVNFNQLIEPLSVLTNLESLTFGRNFNKSIEPLSALTNLESLTFGWHFNQPIESLSALTNLKSLTFKCDFNQPIEPLSALTNLESLTFGWDFNKPIKPLSALTNLKTLVFGENFNQALDALEGLVGSLESLTFKNSKQAELSPEFLSKFKKLREYGISGRVIKVQNAQ